MDNYRKFMKPMTKAVIQYILSLCYLGMVVKINYYPFCWWPSGTSSRTPCRHSDGAYVCIWLFGLKWQEPIDGGLAWSAWTFHSLMFLIWISGRLMLPLWHPAKCTWKQRLSSGLIQQQRQHSSRNHCSLIPYFVHTLEILNQKVIKVVLW